MVGLGVKTDPIETRYSFEWLFRLLREEGIEYVQIGSFFELYWLDDGYFVELRELAERYGLKLKSQFTAHRELGGFFYGDPYMEKAARQACERFIHVASVLGVDYCGWNPGAVYRDRMDQKEDGIERFLVHMKELQALAHDKGVKALSLEPMSCLAEYPTLPEEMTALIGELDSNHQQHSDETVPVWLCGDISHGYADTSERVVHDNWALFEHAIPMMCEFHIKNTDATFHDTFGFTEAREGIVDLDRLHRIVTDPRHCWPVDDLVGYLEISGPKVGRDYSDADLERTLRESLRSIQYVFSSSGTSPAEVEASSLSAGD